MSAVSVRGAAMSVDREIVLGTSGTVKDLDVPMAPLEAGPGVVFTKVQEFKEATSVRLHFTVDHGMADSDWAVVVVGADGRRWEHRPETADDDEFWSDEVGGSSATVQLVSTVERTHARILLDRIAGTKPSSKPKGIIGDDDREAWPKQQEPFLTLGRSVVRLRFVDDVHKKVFVCTGWLAFTDRHILTNEHCINTRSEARSALVDFDFDRYDLSAPPTTVRLRRIVMTDARLDFSLLELRESARRPVLAIGSKGPSTGDALLIIEHPAGEPKQLSRIGCKVAQAEATGTTDDKTDFAHLCDTLGGSSGSPVLDATKLVVVGLHHLGYSGTDLVNRAVCIDQISAAISSKVPKISEGSAAAK